MAVRSGIKSSIKEVEKALNEVESQTGNMEKHLKAIRNELDLIEVERFQLIANS